MILTASKSGESARIMELSKCLLLFPKSKWFTELTGSCQKFRDTMQSGSRVGLCEKWLIPDSNRVKESKDSFL